MNPLEAISPIDGRYHKYTKVLAEHFSEAGIIGYRIKVEGEYLIALSEFGGLGLRKISDKEKQALRNFFKLETAEVAAISDLEFKGYKNIPPTNHDVKAAEYFLKAKLSATSLRDTLEWVHFGLTSEDINNLAVGLMLQSGINQAVLPALEKLQDKLASLAKKYQAVAMLARTHGQPASPTTFGKEFKVYAERLKRQISLLKRQEILVKLNGATGNYNAHLAAYPKIDWLKFSQGFIRRLNGEAKVLPLVPNLFTTQIEPHDSYVELFDNLRRVNTILIGLNQDIWRYISDGWLVQKAVEGEVGSSTMPHKINPIKFENSEGNLGLANSLFSFFANKLPISRLQRDLSDSTVIRNFGTALGHCLIAYASTLAGLEQLSVDEEKVNSALAEHPEVLAEAIQTVLRREGAPLPYEQLKKLTRGRKVSLKDFEKFIGTLKVSDKVKKELLQFKPENYIGIAKALAVLD